MTDVTDRDENGLLVVSDSLTYTVPQGSSKEGATVGQEIEVEFTYSQVDSDELANKVLADKKWTLQDLVNKELKARGRQNAYAKINNEHKPPKLNVPVEDVLERMAKDYQRVMNVSFDEAKAHIDSLMSQRNG